jgi:hypothetical protein
MGSPGSFDLSPAPAAIAMQAMPIVVAKYTPSADDGDDEDSSPYTVLPNVRCMRIDYREGPAPPVARFQYFMSDLLTATAGWPSQFEQLWPLDAKGDYVVMTDDRLVVLSQVPPASPDEDPQNIVLFDGFAQIPQTDVSAQKQDVSFVAVGAAIRLWDDPIEGRFQRNADEAITTDGSADVGVALPCRFNPSDTGIGTLGGYVGNAVGSGYLTSDPDLGDYPVFIEPFKEETENTQTGFWDIKGAVSYLIAKEPSPKDPAGNVYVKYPTIESLADLLATYAPPDDGTGTMDPDDAQQTNVRIRDYDASNRPVPDAMAELMRYAGFVMVFSTTTDEDGNPQNKLSFKRRDGLSTVAPKPLYLAAGGATTLDPAANNTTSMHLARDCNSIVNSWDVETELQQYEVDIILAPLFQPASGDASAANVIKWQSNNLANATDNSRRMYRWWGADECGDGHAEWGSGSYNWVTGSPIDFSPIFPPDEDTGKPTYVRRYRPGSNTLIAKDASGKPLKAVLRYFVGNKFNAEPQVITESTADQLSGYLVATSGWRLLDDRLGIEIDCPNPEAWLTGANTTVGSGTTPTVMAVTLLANPPSKTGLTMVLTTVIEGDFRLDPSAPKRVASPTQFTRRRSIDGRDHYQYCAITPGSYYYSSQTDMNGDPADGSDLLVARDDTEAATTYAKQLRSAHEFPTLAGSAALPFVTNYYQIGDRVNIIQGRDANMQINVGSDQGEAPSYPWITAFSWDFQGDKQQTILQFSDRRAEPQGV